MPKTRAGEEDEKKEEKEGEEKKKEEEKGEERKKEETLVKVQGQLNLDAAPCSNQMAIVYSGDRRAVNAYLRCICSIEGEKKVLEGRGGSDSSGSWTRE